MAMQFKFRVRRGPKARLPDLEAGEFGFATDSQELFIGTDAATNVQIESTASVDAKIAAHKTGTRAHDVSVITGAETTAGAQAKVNTAQAAAALDAAARVAAHANRGDNPHNVTLAQVGAAPAAHVNAALGSGVHPMPSAADVGAATVGHNHAGAYEPVLGNPVSDGQMLASTATGVRSWKAAHSVPGLTGYVAAGRKFAAGSNLDLAISTGTDAISGRCVDRAQNALTLHPRRAQLVYDTLAGTSGIIDAAFPAADAGTVCRWIVDGSATIASTVGGNNLVRGGTITAVSGWASDYAGQGDAASGAYASANYANFPSTGQKEMVLLFTQVSIIPSSGYQLIAGVAGSLGIYNIFNGASRLAVNFGPGDTDTGYILDAGVTYILAIGRNAAGWYIKINGNLVYISTVADNSWGNTLYLFRGPNTAYWSGATIHYFEIRNAPRADAQNASISNALLLPCRYEAETEISAAAGTATGNMTGNGGVAAGFNGVIAQTALTAPTANTYSGYIGKNWGTPKTIARAIVYPTSDNAFDGTGTAYNVTITLQGSNDSTNGLDGTWQELATTGSFPDAIAGNGIGFPLRPTSHTAFVHHRIKVNTLSGYAYVGELKFYEGGGQNDIRVILPVDSLALGRVITDATHPIEYNDADYQYGRRERAVGGNRKVFLGWRYFSGQQQFIYWTNSFGTRKVKTVFTWAQDTSGTLEAPCIESNAQSYSLPGVFRVTTPNQTIGIATGNGVDGNLHTSGYIGCYAEVIE